MTMTSLLARGLLVGLLAGVFAFGFARIFGEPPIDRAIAFEDRMQQARGEASEPELVSRPTQAGIGLFTGVLVYGVALGGLFALAFAGAYGRVAGLSPRATAALLALGGFLVVILVPALKYPPNPPSIGDPATIGQRTALYFTMIAVSLAAAVLAFGLARRLSARLGAWNGVLLAILAFAAIVAVAQYVLPDIDGVPDGFSAALLWRFRTASLGVNAVIWATLGIGFAIAAEHALNLRRSQHRARRAAVR